MVTQQQARRIIKCAEALECLISVIEPELGIEDDDVWWSIRHSLGEDLADLHRACERALVNK